MSKPTAKNVTELYQAARQLLLNTERTPFLEKSLDRVRNALEPFEKSRRGTLDVGCNDEQALYVIPNPSGYSCLGYDVCLARHNALAAWLRSEGLQATVTSVSVTSTPTIRAGGSGWRIVTGESTPATSVRCGFATGLPPTS